MMQVAHRRTGLWIDISRRLVGRPAPRIREYGGNKCSLSLGQAHGRLIEIMLGRRIHTVEVGTRFNHIQIHLQNSLLAPEGLNQHGKPSLVALSATLTLQPFKY